MRKYQNERARACVNCYDILLLLLLCTRFRKPALSVTNNNHNITRSKKNLMNRDKAKTGPKSLASSSPSRVCMCRRCCVYLSIKSRAYRRIDSYYDTRSSLIDCAPRHKGTNPSDLKDRSHAHPSLPEAGQWTHRQLRITMSETTATLSPSAIHI